MVSNLKTTVHKESVTAFENRPAWHQEIILYFGDWKLDKDNVGDRHQSNTQYNAFEFCFRGPTVRWDRVPLEYDPTGYSGYKYVSFWKIKTEPFTCFPIIMSSEAQS